jgi:hypothetical protein
MRKEMWGAAAALAALGSSAALAHGAVAIGLPDNYAEEGFSTGQTYDYGSREEAASVALEQCVMQAREFESVLQERACRVVSRFEDQCLAIAYDPDTGTRGFGWAVADTAEEAEDRAFAACQRSSAPERASFCEVVESDCDGAAADQSEV